MSIDYRNKFKLQTIISCLSALFLCVGLIGLCVFLFRSYVPDNIETNKGIVSNVFIKSGSYKGYWIELSDGTELHIVKSSFTSTENAIGYSISEIDDLLSGREIEYSYFSPVKNEKWLTEIKVGDTKIDISKQCEAACKESRQGVVVVGGIVAAILIAFEVVYLNAKYKNYKKMDKKPFVKRNG